MILEKYIIASALNGFTAVVASVGTAIFAMTESMQMVVVGGLVTIVTSSVGAYFSYKAKTISQESKELSQQTAKAVNGKMEEFKLVAEKLFHAQGVIDGTAQAETKAAVQAVAKAEGKAEALEQQTERKNL